MPPRLPGVDPLLTMTRFCTQVCKMFISWLSIREAACSLIIWVRDH
jgi:hypothetical protein